MVKEELAGRFSDFHALRYTFNTWLHTNGVPQRMAQELMRHSDRRLTDQVYLDSSLLPLQDCMMSIGHKNKWTQKWTQISGETSHLASRVVGGDETVDSSKSSLSARGPGEICRTMTRIKSGGMDGTRTRNRVMLNPSRSKGFRL